MEFVNIFGFLKLRFIPFLRRFICGSFTNKDRLRVGCICVGKATGNGGLTGGGTGGGDCGGENEIFI